MALLNPGGKWAPYGIIILCAALLVMPAALTGPRLHDSFWIDWVWIDQFSAQLRSGTLYPRWLPLSHGGLGSPVFYYYPPIAFYIAAAFGFIGFSTYASLIAAFGAGFALSGIMMFLWLKERVAVAPLIGALLYMAGPYHAFDFYARGALAELVAMAWLPAVALGLLRISEQRPKGIAITALGYAALIGTHLPLALMSSLFFIAPYALVLMHKRPSALLRCAAALVGGIALASIYLLPALWLHAYRDSAQLWKDPYYQPDSWTYWNGMISDPSAFGDVLIISGYLAVPMLALLLWQRSRWAAYGLLCCAIGVGLVPFIWRLPLLSAPFQAAQFPFRILPLAEFALAAGLAVTPWRPLLSIFLAITPLYVTATFARLGVGPQWTSIAALQANHPDVPENLPPGNRPVSWPSHWAMQVAANNPVKHVSDSVTIEPIFYFPAWEVRCEGAVVQTFAAPATQLLAYKGEGCNRRLISTDAERGGALISLGALIALLMSLFGRKRRRTDSADAIVPRR